MKKTAAERQNAEKTVFKTTLVAKTTKRNDPRTCENYRKLISRTGKTGLNRKNADKDSKKIKTASGGGNQVPANTLRTWQIQTPVRPFDGHCR